jgi:hypothetical protein
MKSFWSVAGGIYLAVGFLFTLYDRIQHHGIGVFLSADFDSRDHAAIYRNVLWPLRLLNSGDAKSSASRLRFTADTKEAMEELQEARAMIASIFDLSEPLHIAASRALKSLNQVNESHLSPIHPQLPLRVIGLRNMLTKLIDGTPTTPGGTPMERFQAFEDWYSVEVYNRLMKIHEFSEPKSS